MGLRTINQTTPKVTVAGAALRLAALGNLQIAYRDGGQGANPVMLIHGLCSMVYTWQDVFEAIAARHRTVALDLKGFGASDKPEGDYRLEAQAEIVLRLMDELGLERATLVGNSMGGAVALRLAECWPHRVTRLVLVDPAAYQAHTRSQLARLLLGSSGVIGQALGLHALKRLMRSPAFIENRMRFIYGRHSIITPERVAAYHSVLSDEGCQRAIIAMLQAWDLRPIERDLRLVRQPTLVIWGEHDRLIRPRFGQRLVRDLPHAELRIMPCGHAPQEEMPLEFARLVNDFLKQ